MVGTKRNKATARTSTIDYQASTRTCEKILYFLLKLENSGKTLGMS